MRLVPPQAAGLALAAMSAILIAGCGGSPSSQSNVSALNSAVLASSNATSAPAASNTTSPPPSGGTSSPAPTPTSGSTAPAGSTIANIEQMSGWDSCDTCSGGGTISYSMTQALSYPQPATASF